MTSTEESEPHQSPPEEANGHSAGGSNDAVPRPKRIACILCRKRKLRCDGNKPSCGTCSRLNHHCEYSEERKKSGPKRGYVKLLEARLKQVENLLETRDTNPEITAQAPNASATLDENIHPPMPSLDVPSMGLGDTSMSGMMDTSFTDPMGGIQDFASMNVSDDFSWEMIGLGLEEALPSREVIDELYVIDGLAGALMLTSAGMRSTSRKSTRLCQ